MNSSPTACLIIIGNEILSGRTKDKNLGFLGEHLNEIGIRMMECRVIPDIEQSIIDTVNELRAKYTYVFTTGGIGPTHDDITTESVAKAFGLKVICHPEAERRLLAHYDPKDVNEARMKMANTPEGAELIDNPISAAPGFYVENVFVMAGIPSVMQAMYDFIRPLLKRGKPMMSNVLEVSAPEGNIAQALSSIQATHEHVEIGVYPKLRDGKLASTIVLRCDDFDQLTNATADTEEALSNAEIIIATKELEAEAR